jgi:hypothetical protein
MKIRARALLPLATFAPVTAMLAFEEKEQVHL